VAGFRYNLLSIDVSFFFPMIHLIPDSNGTPLIFVVALFFGKNISSYKQTRPQPRTSAPAAHVQETALFSLLASIASLTSKLIWC
jgi:hypothetical protein